MKNFTVIAVTVLLFLLTNLQCTTTRWSVDEFEAMDDSADPELIDTEYIVQLTDSVSHENPFLNFNLYRVDHLEYPQRIKLERTLQSYRPRWGFSILAALGSAVAFYAGSTDRMIGTTSPQQSLAFYTAGTVLAVAAFTNMEPVGDPIRTGETRMLRESGSTVVQDTVRVEGDELADVPFFIRVSRGDDQLMNRVYEASGDGEVSLRLADLLMNQEVTGADPGYITVEIEQNRAREVFEVPIDSFLRPVVSVTSDVAELYRERDTESEPLTQVGSGSEFPLLSIEDENWYQLRFGGSELYMVHDAGEIYWAEVDRFDTPSVVPASYVPFGEISVEFSVPVLRTEETGDAVWLIENVTGNNVGVRRHIDRDLRLMELYFREALAVPLSSIFTESYEPGLALQSDIARTNVDSESTLFTYISGFASLRDVEGVDEGIDLVYLHKNGDTTRTSLDDILESLVDTGAGSIVIFADLEFQHALSGERGNRTGNGALIYETVAARLQEVNENAAIIFSTRPDQPSGLYESIRFEMKFHHLFPYYLAQGMQQRRTRLSELVRFVENQVDFTSRRLHDRPQSVQAFGNLSIDLADQSE